MEHLLSLTKSPPPYGDLENIHGWIRSITFVDLLTGDSDAGILVRYLLEDNVNQYHPIFAGDDHLYQMAMRCACALDFCQGKVDKRKDFDWAQPPKHIYEFLLIEFWRRTAMHWAWISFPQPKILVDKPLAPNGSQLASITPIQHSYDIRAFYCWPSAPSGEA